MGLILPKNMAKITELGRDVKVGKLKPETSKRDVPLARIRSSAHDLGVAVGGRKVSAAVGVRGCMISR